MIAPGSTNFIATVLELRGYASYIPHVPKNETKNSQGYYAYGIWSENSKSFICFFNKEKRQEL